MKCHKLLSFIPASAFLLSLFACSTQAPDSPATNRALENQEEALPIRTSSLIHPVISPPLLPSPTSTIIPTPFVTPSPIVQDSPTFTPAAPLENLLTQAIPLCDAASSKGLVGGSLSGQVLTLINDSPGLEHWYPAYNPTPFEAQVPAQVQNLVCVLETYERFASYDDGSPANRTIWNARIVRWPSGEVAAVSPALTGDRPPVFKEGEESASGKSPIGELIQWLTEVFNDRTIFVHEPYYDISHVVFSPNGESLATVSWHDSRQSYAFEDSQPWKPTIKVWDIASGKLRYTIPLPDYSSVFALAITPDGQSLAAFHDDEYDLTQISSWILATGEPDKQVDIALDKHGSSWNNILQAVFTPDTSLVAIANDKYVSIFNTASGAFISAGEHSDEVRNLAFSPDNSFFASSDNVGELKVWQVASGEMQYQLRGRAILFSPDGKELTVESAGFGSDLQGIVIADALTGTVLNTLGVEELRDAPFFAMAYSPDSLILAVGSTGYENNDIILWDVQSSELISVSSLPRTLQYSPDQVVFTPDSQNLAINLIAGDGTGYVKIYSLMELLSADGNR